MRLKHVAVRHAGMLTIIPDVIRISTQEAGEELISAGELQTWSENTVTITRANGKRLTFISVTEVSSLYSRKQEKV